MKWFNPGEILPMPGQSVWIAMGQKGRPLDYRSAMSCGGNGGFNISNGSYGDSTIYAVGKNDASGNANKVIAWAEIELFKGDYSSRESGTDA